MTRAAAVARVPAQGPGFWGVWWFACAVFVGSAVLAHDTRLPGRVPDIWLISSASFSWLTLTWRGIVPSPSRPLLLTMAMILGLSTLTAASLGASPTESLLTASGVCLQAALTCASYRWLRQVLASPAREPARGAAPWRRELAREWAPTGARDLVALVLCAGLSALAMVPLGAVPGVWSDGSGRDVADWVVRVCVTTFVGTGSTVLVFATWSRAELDRRAWLLPLMGTLSLLVLVWVFEAGAVPMAWLMLLPSLYVASTYRVWATSVYSLALGVAALGISPPPELQAAFDEVLPLTNVIDLLVSACVFIALTIALLNESRQRLVSALAEERTRATEQSRLLGIVFEAMQEGLVVLGPDLAVRMHNRAAVDVLGRPFPAAVPGSWTDYFAMTRVDGGPVSDRELVDLDYFAVEGDGGRRVLRQRRTWLVDDPGSSSVLTFVDVTEQQERLKELRSFAAVVAHDLRAPLTGVEGWLELVVDALEEGRVDEAGSLVLRARQGNARMQEIIDDWLQHTVRREGALHLTEFPLATPVNVVVGAQAGNRRCLFETETPHAVHADLGMVRQLLDNLVGNAVKYTPPGEVPHVRIESSAQPGDMVRVEVSDRGIGLPPGEEDRIFEEYHRAEEHADGYEGTGLGLSLCRRIVERHGGSIRATGNQHGGATISFTLPAATPTRTRPREAVTEPARL